MHNTRYTKASSRIARRSEVKRIFGLILKIGLPVVFLVGFILLLRADFLQIKNFEITGTKTLSEESIKNLASSFATGTNLFLIPKSNILFFNKDQLTTALISEFSRLEKVEVNKKFFSQQIQIKIVERNEDFLWCSEAGLCFFMTKDGLVFQESKNASSQLIFKGLLKGDPLMQSFATPVKIQNYLKLVEAFKIAGFNVSSVNIESNDKAIAQTDIGDVYLNPEESDLFLVAQNVLLLINETKNKNPSARFEYIDARFGNKMFYKLY